MLITETGTLIQDMRVPINLSAQFVVPPAKSSIMFVFVPHDNKKHN